MEEQLQYRMEHDSMGKVQVPADKYWGAQTQRSIQNFPIGVVLPFVVYGGHFLQSAISRIVH